MVNDESVTEIDGVGSAAGDELVDEGFETVGDVADATVDEVSDVKGFGQVKAEETIEKAQEMVEGDADDLEDDSDASSSEVEVNTTSNDATDGDEPTYGVEIDVDDYVGYHIIHVVLEQATNQHQSNNARLRNEAYSVADKLMSASIENDGETFETTLELTESELQSFYRAISSGSLDYNSRTGITSMYGDFNTIKKRINEKRKEVRAN